MHNKRFLSTFNEGQAAVSDAGKPEAGVSKWIEIGLDGWLIGSIGIFVAVILGIWGYKRKKSRVNQSDIHACGSVAGGSIGSIAGRSENRVVTQNRITAGGDVAGGDIKKGN